MNDLEARALFLELYRAPTEDVVHDVLRRRKGICADLSNWRPLGGNDANMSIIQNQQGHPAAALVEKLTNAIDAMLMRRVLEVGIDPKGKKAPKSMAEAVSKFFNKKLWSNKAQYDSQAHDIQLLADGPRGSSSLIIYDNGEGQNPEAFSDTFLSLVKGNKRDIPFVQGMYNMGGTGSIVFCGTHKYQLICSKRYDGKGRFGYTLIRRHPLAKTEESSKRASWYEYFAPGGCVPEFALDGGLDLGLRDREFRTGTVLKLYSYSLPSGLRGNIAQELYQSLSELLIEPALPIWVADSAVRYPQTEVLERSLVGLRRTIKQKSNLIERHLSLSQTTRFGKLQADGYVFVSVSEGKDTEKVRESIKRQFFQNSGAVLFALNGQVQGAWTTQFISQSLNMPLLKDYLLITVDCTTLNADFRNDLFMASRDRLANSPQSQELRDVLKALLQNSELRQIHDFRRNSLGVQSTSAKKTIKSCLTALGLDSNLHAMLAGQIDLESMHQPSEGKAGHGGKGGTRRESEKEKKQEPTVGFVGRKFPTFFRLARPSGSQESTPAAKVPLGGTRSISFNTDVENEYFRRTNRPGRLDLTLFTFRSEGTHGNTGLPKRKKSSAPRRLDEILHFEISDPQDGELRIDVMPTSETHVGDTVEVSATLSGDSIDYSEIFWVKIVEPRSRSRAGSDKEDGGVPGLPTPVLIGKELKEGSDVTVTWADAEGKGISRTVDETLVVYTLMNDGRVEVVYINMDSRVMDRQRAQHPNMTAEQHQLLNNQYIATMYLHALLLCGGMGVHGYGMTKPSTTEIGSEIHVDVSDFIADLFADGYAEFLMQFGSKGLVDLLND